MNIRAHRPNYFFEYKGLILKARTHPNQVSRNTFMPSRFIIIFFILLLLPFYGIMQIRELPFTEGERPVQLIYDADTNLIRNLVEAAADIMNHMPDSALALLTRALEESRQGSYEYGTGISWLGMGYVYMNKAMYRESIHAYRQALYYSYRVPRLENKRADIYNNMAVQHMYLGEFYQSMICLGRAALSIEKGYGQTSMSSIYNNIPILLRYIAPSDGQDHEQTTYYLDIAEATARREKNYASLGSALISKGIHYGRQKQWDQSLHIFTEALTHARQHHLVNTEASALNNLATLYLQYLQADSARKAITYLNEALTLRNRVYRHHYIKTLHVSGQAYYSIGNYKKSEPLLQQALKEAQATSYSTELPNIYHSLSQLYTKTQNYREALEYYRQHVAAKDSITGKEIANNVHLLETRYRTAEKDKEILQKGYKIALQENKLKEKNTWIISITAGALFLASLLVFAYRSNKQQQRLQAHKIQNLQQEQEIVRLKAIMDGEEKERARIARDLHDGIVGQLSATRLSFGAIQNRQAATDERKADFPAALRQLDETIDELRKTAHNLMPEILLQAGLVEAVKIFCDKMSKGASPAVSFLAPAAVPMTNPDFELILYRITQELIQNAVKHAQAGQVLVQLDYQDNLLSLTVEDDGCGFDQAKLNGHKGMGLNNLQTRVKALGGIFSITSRPGEGTSVYLEFEIPAGVNQATSA